MVVGICVGETTLSEVTFISNRMPKVGEYVTIEYDGKKVLGMIEELNPDSEFLTDDPDIAAKINEVINQVMFELARIRKLPKYVDIAVKNGDIIDFAKIEKACGYEAQSQVSIAASVLYRTSLTSTLHTGWRSILSTSA